MSSIIQSIRAQEDALTVPKLAKKLSISSKTLYGYVVSGSLPCFRVGSSIRLDPKVVADWLEARNIAA
jgi:excisionase family DNA binding protein